MTILFAIVIVHHMGSASNYRTMSQKTGCRYNALIQSESCVGGCPLNCSIYIHNTSAGFMSADQKYELDNL